MTLLQSYLEFIKELELLKNITRTAWTLMMALVHDLGEIYDGDISAALLPDPDKKYKSEAGSVSRLLSLLEEPARSRIASLWQEYEDGRTAEAKLVKALDKAETILQHNQGMNPSDFDYEFNLQYGAAYFREDGLMAALRDRLDQETKRHIM